MSAWTHRVLVSIWLLFCSCPPADAQPVRIPGFDDYPGLDIQAAVGWEDVSHSGHPLAISLRISNSSARVLEGRVLLGNSMTGETRLLGEVAVGPGGIRHFGTVAALAGWDTCDLSFESAEAVLWARQLSVPAVGGAVGAFKIHGGLFVEDGRRRLNLPLRPVLTQSAQLDRVSGNGSASGQTAGTDFTVRGSGLAELSAIPPWQLPVHPGPLTAVRTVLLSPVLSPEQLSDGQYRALARWVAMGGVVMLAAESAGMLERLREHLPLQPRSSLMLDGLKAYPCGQGTIREFSATEFAEEGSATRVAIGEAVASAVSGPLFARVTQRELEAAASVTDPGHVAILALFGLYAVAAALPIVMFRSTRRRQISWIVGVVLTACAGAGVLGVAIRSRPGNVSMKTLTWIGEDCLVQAASMTLKSAGRSQLQLELSGQAPDLQPSGLVMDGDRWFSGMPGTWSPSSWMENAGNPAWTAFNLAKSTSADPGRTSLSVQLSPWSSRQVTGVDLRTLEGRLEVTLESISSGGLNSNERWHEVASFPQENLRVRLKSSLPFRLKECRLGMVLWRRPVTSGAEWMLFHRIAELPDPAAAPGSSVASVEQEFDAGLVWIADHTGVSWQYLQMSSMVPPGEMEVWVEGRLESSPLMQLEGGDFRESGPAEHWFYYRVPRENLPEGWRELQEWKTPSGNR